MNIGGKTGASISLALLFLTTFPAFADLDISSLRGAGLTDKQGSYRTGKYRESDFQYLASLGANFVRLPVSFIFLAKEDSPAELDESRLVEIDQAIAWGRRYGLHVCLNLFATPGYTIAEPNQSPSLWADENLQRTFVSYWQALAHRYRDIPSEALSFNLLNEPSWDLPEGRYAPLMRRAIHAVHAEDSKRWIFVDGLKCGTAPVMSLADEPRVAQALHFYEPFSFTHYGASWVEHGGERLPRPQVWPAPAVTDLLFGPRQDIHSPVVLQGPFPKDSTLRLRVGLVTESPSEITFTADDREVSRISIDAATPWHDTDYAFTIPPHAAELRLTLTRGDRITFRELTLADPASGQSWTFTPGSSAWEAQHTLISFDSMFGLIARRTYGRAWISQQALAPWRPLLKKGIPVMIQEFGVHNQTPSDATLAYLADCIATWNEARLGWALFTMRDSLGWIDNGRKNIATNPLPDGSPADTAFEQFLREQFRQGASTSSSSSHTVSPPALP